MDFEAIKKRKIVQWAIGYGVFAVGAAELLQWIEGTWGWPPPSVVGRVQVLLALGFLLVVALAWFHGERGKQEVTKAERVIFGLFAVVAALAMWLVNPGGPPALNDGEPPSTLGRPTVAVFPFEDLSADTADQGFAYGMEDEVRASLAGVGSIAVMAEQAVAQFGPNPRTLTEVTDVLSSLEYALFSSFDKSAGQVIVEVRLVDVRSGELLYGERYERSFVPTQIYAAEREIALSVAEAIHATVSPDEEARLSQLPTSDSIAYELYTRALRLDRFVQSENRLAATLLAEAVGRDTLFAAAWAFRSYMNSIQTQLLGGASSAVADGLPYAERAVAIAPDNWMGYQALAQAYRMLGRVEEEQEALSKLMTLRPDYWYPLNQFGYLSFFAGRYPEAMRHAGSALEVWPEAGATNQLVGLIWMMLGDLDRAEAWVRHAIAVEPRWPIGPGVLAQILSFKGEHEAAQAVMDDRLAGARANLDLMFAAQIAVARGELPAALGLLDELDANGPDWVSPQGVSVRGLRGVVLHALGRDEEARAVLALDLELRERAAASGNLRTGSPVERASAHALLGNADAAIALLEVAREGGWTGGGQLPPGLNQLEGDPRFEALRDRLAQERQAMRTRIEREALTPPLAP